MIYRNTACCTIVVPHGVPSGEYGPDLTSGLLEGWLWLDIDTEVFAGIQELENIVYMSIIVKRKEGTIGN